MKLEWETWVKGWHRHPADDDRTSRARCPRYFFSRAGLRDPAGDAGKDVVGVDIVPEQMMAFGVKDIFLLRCGDTIEKSAALVRTDKNVAAGGEHQRGHFEAAGRLLRRLHEVVEAGEKVDGETAHAVRDVVEVGHVFVVGGESGDGGFSVDEAHGAEFDPRGQAARLPQERDDPPGNGRAGFGHGDREHQPARVQGAVGHRIDRDERAHALADEMKGCTGQKFPSEGGEVGAPFLWIKKMSAAPMIGIVALSAQIDRPDGETSGREVSGERTEIRRGAA